MPTELVYTGATPPSVCSAMRGLTTDAVKERTMAARKSTEDRFWEKVNKDGAGGCWLWTAGVTKGYGRFWDGKRTVQAHRWSWEDANGAIPGSLDTDHLCRVRRCVNPAHLETVTHQVNVLRGFSPSALGAQRTRCPKGHPYKGLNLYIGSKSKRYCCECHRAHARKYYANHREEKLAYQRAYRAARRA